MPGVGSDVRTAQLEPNWSSGTSGYVEDLAWSGRGDLLATAAVEGPVTLFDGASGDLLHELPGHDFGTSSVSFSGDGRLLASAGQDGKVRLWDPFTGGELCALDGGSAWVEKVNFSPDGCYLVSAAGKRIRMWKPHGGEAGPEPLWESADHESTVTDVRWKPGSSKELVSAAYGGLTFYKPGTPEPLRRFEWKGSTLAIEWSPNGKYIATGDQDSTVHFWIVATGEDLQMFGYPTKVRELSWDPTSRYLATGGGPGVTVWDLLRQGSGRHDPDHARRTRRLRLGPGLPAPGTAARLRRTGRDNRRLAARHEEPRSAYGVRHRRRTARLVARRLTSRGGLRRWADFRFRGTARQVAAD